MEKKIYKKPLISEVIDLDGELCDIQGQSHWTDGTDDIPIIDEPGDLDDWNYAKKSTLWDDEDED